MGIFAPAWHGISEKKALKAVSKISDRTKLEEVANNAPLEPVRYYAIKKIDSLPNTYGVAEKLFSSAINMQHFLQVIALTDPDRMFRKYAVGKLANQAIVAQIAKNDEDECVRAVAVEKLTDQSILSDIAKNDRAYSVRKEAVRKITDQRLLSDIAKTDYEYSVRREAIIKVDDPSVLADISLNDKHWEVRCSAIMKITDQSVIGNYLVHETKCEGYYNWFKKCNPDGLLEKISTPAVIAYVAKETKDEFLGEKAVKKIADEAMLISIAKSSKSENRARTEAIERINDGNALAELAMDAGMYYLVRIRAVEKLTDLTVLCNLAKNEPDKQIRHSALCRLKGTCPHEWSYDAHCRRKCAICGIYEYDHDYVQVSVKDYGGASHSKDYVCKRCGHKANYSQGENSVCDERETGYIDGFLPTKK